MYHDARLLSLQTSGEATAQSVEVARKILAQADSPNRVRAEYGGVRLQWFRRREDSRPALDITISALGTVWHAERGESGEVPSTVSLDDSISRVCPRPPAPDGTRSRKIKLMPVDEAELFL